MLAEYLRHNHTAVWSHPTQGVTVCRFSCDDAASSTFHSLTPVLPPKHFEAFFCRSGRLSLQRSHQHQLMVLEREIFLLSDASTIESACFSGDLSGIVVIVDGQQAQDSLLTLCALTGGSQLDTTAVGRCMRKHDGCAVIGAAPWSNAVFDSLDALDETEHARYSLWKALELLYLLSCRDFIAEATPQRTHHANSLAPVLVKMTTYMQQHLSEKLTIDILSTRFGVSQTVLKKEFRQLYGQPIHAWLQEQRLSQAATLLRDSDMTVLEIAQEVGYSSTSQFSNAFTRRYALTPGQYRRRSV